MAQPRITLRVILQHMQAMEHRLMSTLGSRIDSLDTRLSGKIESLATRMDRMERKMDNHTLQLDAIDKRLDAVEIEDLPKRVRRLERHTGLARK